MPTRERPQALASLAIFALYYYSNPFLELASTTLSANVDYFSTASY
jgi:hypothetical protein